MAATRDTEDTDRGPQQVPLVASSRDVQRPGGAGAVTGGAEVTCELR